MEWIQFNHIHFFISYKEINHITFDVLQLLQNQSSFQMIISQLTNLTDFSIKECLHSFSQ